MCVKEKETNIHTPAVTFLRLFVDGLAASAGLKSQTPPTSPHTQHTTPPLKKSQSQGSVERVAGCDAGWRARGQSECECECEKSGRCRGGEEKPGLFAEAESQIESFILTLPSVFPSICPSLPLSLLSAQTQSHPHSQIAEERRT